MAMESSNNTKVTIRDRVDVDHPVRILLVEDDLVNQKVIRGLLRIVDLTAEVAGNGALALDMMRSNEPYDLVLMDINMPVMNGLQAMTAMRDDEKLKYTPVIAVTTNVDNQGRMECFAAGANAFVSKPVMPADFYAALKEWLPANGIVWPELTHSTDSDQAQEQDLASLQLIDELKAIEGLDMSACYALFQSDYGAFVGYLKQFLDSHSHDANKINQAVADHDSQTATRIAHTVKGLAGTLGLFKLQEISLQLEKKLHQDIRDFSVLTDLQQFEHHLQQIKHQVDNLSFFKLQPASQGNSLADEEMKVVISQLIQLLKEYDSLSIQLWEEYLDHFKALLGNAEAAAVAEDIDNMNFPAAAESLQQIFDKFGKAR